MVCTNDCPDLRTETRDRSGIMWRIFLAFQKLAYFKASCRNFPKSDSPSPSIKIVWKLTYSDICSMCTNQVKRWCMWVFQSILCTWIEEICSVTIKSSCFPFCLVKCVYPNVQEKWNMDKLCGRKVHGSLLYTCRLHWLKGIRLVCWTRNAVDA